MESLQTVVASKASCKQRQGRAGRLGPGLCFRMYPQSWWADGSTPEHGVSEMQRSPLERLVLQVRTSPTFAHSALGLPDAKSWPSAHGCCCCWLQSLVLGVPAPEEFLLDAMEPPAEVTVIEAVARLIDVGAVEADRTPARGRAGGRYDAGGPCGRHDAAPRCGRLTDLGRICADLPLDIQLTRLILLGRVFGLTGDAIDLAACMSSTRLFRRGNRDQELEAFASRLAWSDGSQSDAIAALNIYRAHRANRLRNDRFVDRAALREIDDLVQDTRSRLASVHISPDNLACALDSEFARKAGGVLYLLLYGAAYPNVFGGNARKFLSVAGDDRIDDLLETKQAEVVIEVANAPNSAEDHGQTPLRQTEHDIGEVFEAAGRVREVSLVWSDQDRSNWLVKFDAGRQAIGTHRGPHGFSCAARAQCRWPSSKRRGTACGDGLALRLKARRPGRGCPANRLSLLAAGRRNGRLPWPRGLRDGQGPDRPAGDGGASMQLTALSLWRDLVACGEASIG